MATDRYFSASYQWTLVFWTTENKNWEIVYNNNFAEEEVDALELSTRQKLYHREKENDTVWQQKQNVSNI